MQANIYNSGFTLLEILVVLSLLTVFTVLDLPTNITTYEQNVRRADQQLLITAIRKARSDAMESVCEDPNCDTSPSHGARITNTQITLFEGSTYANRYIPADIILSYSAPEDLLSATSTEVVFDSITGDVSSDQIISVIGPDHHIESISINTEGMIFPQSYI